jgi:hypothetical protein
LSSRKHFLYEKEVSLPSLYHQQDNIYFQNHLQDPRKQSLLFILGQKLSYISHQTAAKDQIERRKPHLSDGYGLSQVHY